MWNFLKKLFSRQEEFFPGVLIEKNEIGNTIEFQEVVSAPASPNFPVKKTSELIKYPYQYQASSSACVAYTMAKIACVLYYLKTGRKIKFSPAFFYPRRLNKPGLGMYFVDIADIASQGSCLYDLLPCDGMTEEQINLVKVEDYHKASADAFAVPKDWIELTDFDTVAATIEKTGKPVMLWFEFGPNEFFRTQYPKIKGSDKRWKHSVCATESFTDIRSGIQYIKIEDSADREDYYEKYITREFFSNRCILKRYPRNFTFVKEAVVPVYSGTISSMQDILRALGYFPSSQISTGYWGNLTDTAVRDFCKAYGLAFVAGRKIWPELEQKLYSFS